MLALGVSASVSVLALLLSLVMEHVLLARSSLASPDEMALGIEVLINAGGYAVFLAAGVLFLFWIHDANRSARSLGAAGMRYTPRAAVIWWFIPLASLIVPYRAMAELWRVSHARNLDTWQAADTSAVMPCWWTLWLFALVMDRITSANESSGSPSQTAPIVAALVNVAGALLAAYVVFSIQRGLTDKAHGASE
jgi:hypothetical protein